MNESSVSFDYYRVFYEVAQCKSITTAAQRLSLTQPTVSKYIQNLERDLDCRLFLRSQKGVTLTVEGQVLLKQIGHACQQMDRAQGMLQEYRNSQNGKITIGASELTMRYFLLPCLEQFRRSFPNINISIQSSSTPTSLSALEAETVDFSLSITPFEGTEKYLVTPVSDFQDVVIAGSRFSYLQDRALSLNDLQHYPIVCMEQGSTTRKFWNEIFRNSGLELTPSIEVNSNDLIPPTVLHNLGIGFCPYEFVRSYLEEKSLIRLNLNAQIPMRKICILQNPNHSVSPATKALLRILRRSGNAHSAEI